MADRRHSLLSLAPLAAAAAVAVQLFVSLARPARVALSVEARCSESEQICSLLLPSRRAPVQAIELWIEGGTESAAGTWELCARGQCALAPAHIRYGWTELAAPRLSAGEAVEVRLREGPPGLRLPARVSARVICGFAGWREVLRRAGDVAFALFGGG